MLSLYALRHYLFREQLLLLAVLPENILWFPLASAPAALEIIFHICLHIALINASSRSLWALSKETGHETNGRQAEGCGM